MTASPTAAAERLAAVLTRENAALAAVDLQGAAGMLAEKQAAVADLLDAMADGAAPRAAQARLLNDLAGENRKRLEQAIAVQGRVIGLIAAALRDAAPCAARYGAGGLLTAGKPAPVALSARA